MGESAQIAVGQVALNRIEEWSWVDWDNVADQFYGTVSPADVRPHYLEVARKAIEGERMHGCLWVLSKGDVRRLNCLPETIMLSYEEGLWGLYFY